MNKNSLIYFLDDDSVYSYIRLDDVCDIDLCNNNEVTVLYGTYESLIGNGVGISKSVADFYLDNSTYESLIGKTITIDFVNYLKRDQHSKEINSIEVVVKYIYSTKYDDYSVNVSTEKYNELAPRVSTSLNSRIANGIVIKKYNATVIKNLYDAGFKDDTYLTYKIEEGNDWVYNVSLISLAVGIVMFILSIVILINFIHSIFEKEKRTSGVLVSFGLNKYDVSRLYYSTILFVTIIAFIISALLNIASIFLLNHLIKSIIHVSINIVYYNILCLVVSFVPIALILLLAFISVYRGMKKKNAVDIIYER